MREAKIKGAEMAKDKRGFLAKTWYGFSSWVKGLFKGKTSIPEETAGEKGLLAKLKTGLAKTRDGFSSRVLELIKGSSYISQEAEQELENILIGSDVGVTTSAKMIEDLKTALKDSSDGSALDLLKKEMVKTLGQDQTLSIENLPTKPYVILVVGVNGVGKTTTIGKLASRYQAAGKKVLLAAGDTFRAAAIEQLTVWAERSGADIVKGQSGGDSAAVAFDSVQSARSRGGDVVIIDTAGRLHTKVNLMEELKKVKRVTEKGMSDAPHEVLLVLDATTGQNAINQAKQFNEAVGVTGIALTKLDGTAKGGIVLAIRDTLGIPIKLIGMGESLEDLGDFRAADFVEALFAD